MELNSRDGLIGELEERVIDLEKEITNAKKGSSMVSLKLKETEMREGLARREVEMLKANLVSYLRFEMSSTDFEAGYI